MTDMKTPVPDASAAEWGALAVRIPGWQWMPGMLGRGGSLGQLLVRLRRGDEGRVASDAWPDPDDPATAGCLLALLGDTLTRVDNGGRAWVSVSARPDLEGCGITLGRACIAAAAAHGRWPGGEG